MGKKPKTKHQKTHHKTFKKYFHGEKTPHQSRLSKRSNSSLVANQSVNLELFQKV